MDNFSSNLNEQNSNKSPKDYKKRKKLSHCQFKINDDTQKEGLNLNKKTSNLFEGITKISSIKTNKQNKTPILKSISVIDKNIFDLADSLYNNEEHLNKNQIHILKNNEDNPSQNSSLSPEKCLTQKNQSSKLIKSLSKEKKNNNIKKSLFKKNSYNFSNFNFRRKSNGRIKSKRFSQNYGFFFKLKLKEKDKTPSNTPYLDKKFWKSSFDLIQYDANNKVNKKINELNKDYIKQNQIQINKINNIDENEENKEENIIKNDLDKNVLSINNNNLNNIIINNNKDELVGKKEYNKIDDNSKENKNERKNTNNNTIINILNKPFFCCLKS